jgi:hypothetical protein
VTLISSSISFSTDIAEYYDFHFRASVSLSQLCAKICYFQHAHAALYARRFIFVPLPLFQLSILPPGCFRCATLPCRQRRRFFAFRFFTPLDAIADDITSPLPPADYFFCFRLIFADALFSFIAILLLILILAPLADAASFRH